MWEFRRISEAHYCDVEWTGDIDNKRSTSVYYCFILSEGIIWGSKKQSTVSLSSAEAKHIATCQTAKEFKWWRRLYCCRTLGSLKPNQ